jgi:hypothetical protein
LQLQVKEAQQLASESTDSEDTMEKTPAAPQPMVITMPSNDLAVRDMADRVTQRLADVMAEVQKNTQTMAKLQTMTLDTLEDVTDAVSAPRQITLKRDAKGKAIGATSTPIMSEEEPGEATETESEDD